MHTLSRELLSEVLGKKAIWHEFTSEFGFDAIQYEVEDTSQRGNRFQDVINIHELAHKCKEWCTDNKWYILSCFQDGEGYALPCEEEEREQKQWFEANTEPEAIFKACQWIMEQNNEQ